MATLFTSRVWTQITAEATKCRKPADVAVAYFGAKAHTLLPLPKKSSLVVDASLPTVEGGGTCPNALAELQKRGTDIYSAQYLHAKVYAFDDAVFIGSANVSLRSQNTLTEAVIRVESEDAIKAARIFIQSLCVTQLSARDLAELQQHYRPPKIRPPSPAAKQSPYATLVMDLKLEQGPGRETQVQPEKNCWIHYFGIDPTKRSKPLLTLFNQSLTPATKWQFHVTPHHHISTIEIPEAKMPRPAILQMRRVGRHTYDYRVLRPEDHEFAEMDRILTTVKNPLQRSEERRWIIL